MILSAFFLMFILSLIFCLLADLRMSEDVLKVIISDMPMLNTVPADDWCFDDHNIEYVDVSGWPLAKKTTKVVTTLDNPNIHKPIRMLICIFQESAGFVGNHVLKEQTGEIMAAIARNPRHQAVFSNVIFKPALEEHWQLVFSFNSHIKILNNRNKMKMCNLNSKIVHKYKKLREKKFQVKLERGDILVGFYLIGKYWIEYEEGTGLGFNLNDDGKTRIRQHIIGFFKINELQTLNRYANNSSTLDIPKPLKETPLFQDKYQQLKSAELGMKERLSCFQSNNSGTLSLELEDSEIFEVKGENLQEEVSDRRVVFQDEWDMNIQLINNNAATANPNNDFAKIGDTNNDDLSETEKLRSEVMMLRKQLEIDEMQKDNDALKRELLLEEIALENIRNKRMDDIASEKMYNHFRFNHEQQRMQFNEGTSKFLWAYIY